MPSWNIHKVYHRSVCVVKHQVCEITCSSKRGIATERNVLESNSTHLTQIASKLHIHKLEDWYKVPKSHVKAVGGASWLLRQHDTVESLVRTYYPDHQWDHDSFIHSPSPTTKPGFTPQLFMERVIRSLFPADVQIETNLRTGHGIVGDAGVALEIDVYLPDYKLGFEYQDPHHFFNSNYGAYTLAEYKRRDGVKKEQAKKQGITLVNVPFWWDWNADSLVATIKSRLPHILPNVHTKVLPFSDTPSQEIIEKYNFDIPDLGAPLQALYIPQASSFDPTNMLIFEKYDGIRAIWNSEQRQCYSRWGKPLSLPFWFADTFPPIWLDGEMWFGREKGTRYQALKLSRSAPHLVAWSKCKYMVFDTPHPRVRDLPYLSRFSFLGAVLPLYDDTEKGGHPFLKLAPFIECTDRAKVEETFLKIREKGGEGIILRHPLVAYENGYSRSLLKHKGFYDAEACVIRKLSENKFLCLVKKPNIDQEIKTYEVEMSIDEKSFDGDKKDITPGTFVSFKFLGESHGDGPPLHPLIYTIRNDVQDWDQLMHNKRRSIQQTSIWKTRQYSQWTSAEIRRKFFEEIANSSNFDSLVAENWYSVNSKNLLRKGGDAMINQYYGGSYITALLDLFPDIGLQPNKFKSAPKNYWEDQDNAKRFFDDFAKSRGFDPLNPERWYGFIKSDIRNEKGGVGLLRHYQSSLSKALLSTYPFIGLEEVRFSHYAPSSKEDELERQGGHQSFFDKFATSKKMDPKNPESWYGVTTTEVLKQQGGTAIYNFYGSLVKALEAIYPDIGLEVHRFKVLRKASRTSL